MIEISAIQCASGWKKLYQPIIDRVITHDSVQNNLDDKIGIAHVKEKDGMLKITLVKPHNATASLIDDIYEAELMSKEICEFCGTLHDVGVTKNHNYKTCCKSCWEKHILDMYDDSVWQDLTTKKYYKKAVTK